MLNTNAPSPEEMKSFKFNRSKRSDQIVFPTRRDVLDYVREAREFLVGLSVNHRTDGQDVPLFDGWFLRTYLVPHKSPLSRLPDAERKRFLILGAHFDDEVVGTGALAARASAAGHAVVALIFCGGSSGRADHGLNARDGWTVRLYETIQGASLVGIDEIHVIVSDTGIGLPEWFWGSDDAWCRRMGCELGRRYNVDYVVAHHDNPEVESHPDHPAVGRVAVAMTMQGQWTDHHSDLIPDYRVLSGESIRTPILLKYVVWPGKVNPSYNDVLEFDLETALLVARAIGLHRTQTVPIQGGPWGIDNTYALMWLGPRLGLRFGLDVNRPDMTFFEGYETPTGVKVASLL